MNISFLYAAVYSQKTIPVGLAYLVALMKQQGHNVSLFETTFYDFDYSQFNITHRLNKDGKKLILDFKESIGRNRPDLLGVSCASLGVEFSLRMVRELKNRPLVIFGGIGATVDYDNLIKKDEVDYVCVGYGEEALLRLTQIMDSCGAGGRDLATAVKEVPNIVTKDRINKFDYSFPIDQLPVPDWSLFDKRHLARTLRGRPMRWGSFQLTRGCPHSCHYCVHAYYHKYLNIGVNKFKPQKIINEMQVLSHRYRLQIIRMIDDCFGLDYERHQEFAGLYKREIGLPIIVETRPEIITPKMVALLKEMGCISVSIGIEGGNEKQRKEMLNRHYSNDTIRTAFRLLKEVGIRTSSYNIIGLPYDTEDKIEETLRLNMEVGADFVNIYIFYPFPKTYLRGYCQKRGLLETDAIVDYSKKSVIRNPALSKQRIYEIYKKHSTVLGK